MRVAGLIQLRPGPSTATRIAVPSLVSSHPLPGVQPRDPLESVLGATPHEFESRILRQCLTGHDVEGPHRCLGSNGPRNTRDLWELRGPWALNVILRDCGSVSLPGW